MENLKSVANRDPRFNGDILKSSTNPDPCLVGFDQDKMLDGFYLKSSINQDQRVAGAHLKSSTNQDPGVDGVDLDFISFQDSGFDDVDKLENKVFGQRGATFRESSDGASQDYRYELLIDWSLNGLPVVDSQCFPNVGTIVYEDQIQSSIGSDLIRKCNHWNENNSPSDRVFIYPGNATPRFGKDGIVEEDEACRTIITLACMSRFERVVVHGYQCEEFECTRDQPNPNQ